jgi:4-amino-4-deoxy-L-arabinose transferase-like glycosyltransferase
VQKHNLYNQQSTLPAGTARIRQPRPPYFLLLVVLILLAATLFRTWDLAEVSLWGDENSSMRRQENSFTEMMHNVIVNGTQVPLYYVVVHYFPSDNPVLLRLPSVLTAIVGIALFIMVIDRLYGRPRLALWAGALLAFNPYHIWLSRQARFYPQLFLLCLLSSFFFLAMIHRRRTTLMWVTFTLATAGAYLTHYFGIVLPVAQYLYMFAVVRKDRRFFFQWFVAQGLALAPAVGWFVYARLQPKTTYGITWIPEPELSTVPTSIANFTTGYTGTFEWYYMPALLLALIGIGVGIAYVILQWQSQPISLYWLFLVFPPLLLIYLYTVAYLDLSIYMDRYFMGILPGAIMLMLLGWYHLLDEQRHLLVGVAVVFLLSNTASLYDTWRHNQHEMYDFAAAAQLFEQKQQPGEGLIFIPPGTSDIFERYSPIREESDNYFLAAHLLLEEDAQDVDVLLARQEHLEGMKLRRVWVFYRNPNINAHRTLVQGDWDPFEPSRFADADSGAYDWLRTYRENLILHEHLNGIQVLLFEYEVPAYLNFPHPTP